MRFDFPLAIWPTNTDERPNWLSKRGQTEHNYATWCDFVRSTSLKKDVGQTRPIWTWISILIRNFLYGSHFPIFFFFRLIDYWRYFFNLPNVGLNWISCGEIDFLFVRMDIKVHKTNTEQFRPICETFSINRF